MTFQVCSAIKNSMKQDNLILLLEDVDEFELPPSKYKENMAQSCDKLQATLKRLEEFPTFKKINV